MDPATLSRKDVLLRAWPLVFANAAIPLAGVVDTFVLGIAGDETDLGGVALGAALFSIVYWSFYFLRMGTTGLTSQADGAGDEDEVQRSLVRAMVLGLAIGAVIMVAQYPIGAFGFFILQGGEAVETNGAHYFYARSWGAIGAFGVFAITGWLIGLGRSTETLIIHGVISAVNIILDIWFVMGLGFAAGGVGAATAIAEWSGFALGLFFVVRVIAGRGGWRPNVMNRTALLEPAALRKMVDINLNLMIRTWAMNIGFTWFANAGARQSDAVLAGNHVLLQVITITAFVLDAFAFVSETEAGRAVGQNSVPRLRRALILTSEQALVAGAIFAAVLLAWGDEALTLVIGDEDARQAAIDFLPYCAFAPLIGAMAWIFDGIFIGATRGAMLRNSAIAAVIIYLAADFLLSPWLGNQGVWIAFLIYYAARALTLAVQYPALERRLAE
ncbi:MATE family efflux transporter [Hyphobacterium sp.]|uniref:MATE family efflux transporter n=1 Tax=Hyphobacterium sp. TaxID=2004662 RepID=UPI003BAD185B